ncbi:MAG: adenosylmethionine decarboxylase [Pseudomonadota bacterium]
MDARHLFQLGTTDLGSGAAQTEVTRDIAADAAVDQRVDAAHIGALTADIADGRSPCADDVVEPDHFIRRDGKVFAGVHLIIEVIGAEGLNDQARIERAFLDSIDASGATLLHLHLHPFEPQGVSGVAVLAESHISVHTWPERGYGAFDVFMCGGADPYAAVPVLSRAFNAREVRVRELLRGEGLVGE